MRILSLADYKNCVENNCPHYNEVRPYTGSLIKEAAYWQDVPVCEEKECPYAILTTPFIRIVGRATNQ